ncbi:N-acetylmuramoyl-L-alanine amidase [Pueribacillus sp. YX66]|uniref:N-acetylmuramoyl-L-alanine amidase family protein n=1 Tax=Pueribacillus sp. YX66 TaxID=3229242 RepID=UPI00358CECFF
MVSGGTIILNAGHGGYDPGAIGISSVLEKELNLRTAQMVKNKLQNGNVKRFMKTL